MQSPPCQWTQGHSEGKQQEKYFSLEVGVDPDLLADRSQIGGLAPIKKHISYGSQPLLKRLELPPEVPMLCPLLSNCRRAVILTPCRQC